MTEGTQTPTATADELQPGQRHIIKRPRLTKLLDEAEARVILLVAPAGYGKTTLAREWSSQRRQIALWYRLRSGASDIGGLAQGLARAIAPVSARAERTVREFLAAHPEPSPTALADLLARDLPSWPAQTWLVLDEYESIRDGSPPAAFLQSFLAGVGANVLITSRERPSWIRPRDLLYGDVFEVRRSALAMTLEEATEVLAHASHPPAAVVALADGWPAVIGLASLFSGEVRPDSDVHDALFDYFAQELFGSLDSMVQRHLVLLAVPAALSLDLIHKVIGVDAERVLSESVRAGLMSIRSDEMEIHPLCRSFLERKVWDVGVAKEELDALAEHLIDAGEWDDAFELVRRFNLVDRYSRILAGGSRTALRNGRVATLERWITWGEARGLETPEMALSRAEICLCRGDWKLSESLSLACAESAPSASFAAQAYLCAGSAAQFLDRPERARQHYANALSCEDSQKVRRRAVWGRFIALHWEDRPNYLGALAELESVIDSSPEHQIRLRQARLVTSERDGMTTALIDDALAGAPLLDHIEDPFVRSGFLHALAYALNVSARYVEAEHFAQRELDEGERFQLGFVTPNALLNLATAKLGRGSYTAAALLINRSELHDATNDEFLRVKRGIMRANIDLAKGRLAAALDGLRAIDVEDSRIDVSGEALATRALAEACASDFDSAEHTLARAEARASDVVSEVLVAATRAAIALDRTKDELTNSLSRLATTVTQTGCFDSLICALRAEPELLRASLQHGPMTDVVRTTARWSGDSSLVSATCAAPPTRTSPPRVLSSREREVLELAAEGFHNKEIGSRLFISPKTVKTHLQNVYEKLDVNSRTEAVVKARDAGLLR